MSSRQNRCQPGTLCDLAAWGIGEMPWLTGHSLHRLHWASKPSGNESRRTATSRALLVESPSGPRVQTRANRLTCDRDFRKDSTHSLNAGRLHEVLIEPCLVRATLIFVLSPPGHRDKDESS
jgi:hypothetical protein